MPVDKKGSIADIVKDTFRLVTRGTRYYAHPDTIKELPSYLKDLVVGLKVGPKDPDYVYLDLHAHFRKDQDIEELIEEASQRVDVLAIMTKADDICGDKLLTFDEALQKLRDKSIEYILLDTDVAPRVAEVKHKGKTLYLVRGAELECKENLHIALVGNKREYNRFEITIDQAIEESRAVGAFHFMDHVFSIWVPNLVSFRFPTKEEMARLEGYFRKYHPTLETGNHQNTLWMWVSNVLARRRAKEYGLPEVANSDTHLDIYQVGLSRTGIPREGFRAGTEQEFFESLNNAFSQANYRRNRVEGHYASAYSFFKTMLWPKIVGRH